MVRKIAVVVGILLAGAWALSGCSHKSSPVAPRGGGNVTLSLPLSSIRAQIKALDIVYSYDTVRLQYHIVSQGGLGSVDGYQDFGVTDSSANPILNITLPGVGKYLAAVEVYNTSSSGTTISLIKKPKSAKAKPQSTRPSGSTPLLLGADMVDVASNAVSMNVTLGRLDTSCYNGYVYDCDGSYAFNFDQDTYPVPGGGGDIFMDANGNMVNDYAPGQPCFTYLGNGELVDFPQISSQAIFYPSSLAAKGGPVSVGDCFGVKVPSKPNALVWLQVESITTNGTYPCEIDFTFRYNGKGYNYYKFDMTSSGQMNCNDSISGAAPTFLGRRTAFGQVAGVDADAAGRLYVADPGSQMVDILDAAGNTTNVTGFTTPIDVAVGKGSPTSLYVLDSGAYQVKIFNSAGVSLNYFNFYNNVPGGIATDKWGYVYITFQDYTNFNGVVKYDSLGNNATTLVYNVSPGGAPGQFNTARGIAVDDSGNLYVADSGNYCVSVFDKNGAYQRQIIDLYDPYDVALDGSGDLWVADGYRVLKFNAATGSAISGFNYWYDSSLNYYNFNNPQLVGIAFGGGMLYTSDYCSGYGNQVDAFKP